MSASIPLVITLIRLIQGYVKIDIFGIFKGKRNKNVKSKNPAGESLLHEGGLMRTMTKEQEFEWLEKRILETVRTQILINRGYF